MQYLGRATIRTNGEYLPSKKGAKLHLGGAKRSPVVTNFSVGYAEENDPAMVECVVPLARDLSLTSLRNLVDAVVTFECDSGQIYVVRGAFVTDCLELTDGEGGDVQLKFCGEAAEELI
ncbi:MAG: phage tail protein [Candidatus Hydrogenedens sp.]|nr:phage tail protein [Candidatus Hydrogenedens sp.]